MYIHPNTKFNVNVTQTSAETSKLNGTLNITSF